MLTTIQFKTLDDLYMFYNVNLFEARLPECIVNLCRRANSYGFFVPNLWASVDEISRKNDKNVHEISLNPDHLIRTSIEWHSTLVHEMTHLWQKEKGKPSRTGYHNKEWADKMERIGLMPSDTGYPGGKRIGQGMSHFVISGGKFERLFHAIDPNELENLRLKYLPVASLGGDEPDAGDEPDEGEAGTTAKKTTTKSGIRIKYSCDCGNNVWGRSGLQIKCIECEGVFKEACG